jgi:Na+/H+ antiporter
MHITEIMVGLMAAVVLLAVLAQWVRISYPILLVVGGLLLSFQSWAPKFDLPPEIVLFAILPPLLYAAAFNTHWPAFRQQIRSITLLAVGLVIFTMILVAVVCHEWFGLPWPLGFLLGAIVSPPDAVAATSVTQRVRVPKIVVTILEGESLVNDATALVAYRVALAAVGSGTFMWFETCLDFVKVVVLGIAIGLAGAWVMEQVHRWLNRTGLGDVKITITLTLLTPYFVYLPAEHFHVSGVLAVVSAGLYMGSRCERLFTHDLFHEARAVWEMVEFVLNGLVFILIGLQLSSILEDLNRQTHDLGKLCCWAALLCAVVVLSRIAWVIPGAYLPRWMDRKFGKKNEPYPPLASVLVVGWTGMRGVVSLAAALAIPMRVGETNEPFPERGALLFLTYAVIFVTLVGQGLTLPLLIRWLKVDKLAEAETDEPSASC